jgi:O-antigen ligase
MLLQALGLALLAWAAASPTSGLPRRGRQLLLIALLAVTLVTIQMLPLPPSVWSRLGERELVSEGHQILGLGPSWQPLSLAPYATFDAMLSLIPPLALFCTMASLGAYRRSWMIAALIGGTIAAILLGAVQVAAAGEDSSRWYPYALSSFGVATGFFANGNHMATLLLATLPFLAALGASARSANRQRNTAAMVMAGATALLIFVGIALNRSLAAYGLAPAVLAASALILLPKRSSGRRAGAALAALLVVAAIGLLATSSIRGGTFRADAGISVQSRQEMLSTTAKAIGDFMPWGTGLGTFRSVYQLYESPAEVTQLYANHAHNDYAELALETGVPGILLVLAFIAWWAGASRRAWTNPDAGAFAKAASIASAAILVHSIVDFPLRTATIATVFAMCLALLIERRTSPVRTASDLRPTRHIVIE